MQIPLVSVSYSNPSTIFEAILEECSLKRLEGEPHESLLESNLDHAHQNYADHKQPTTPELWFRLDEDWQDSLMPADQPEDQFELHLEFTRVQSCREEQENKISQFMMEDRFRSQRKIDSHDLEDSPLTKSSKSLSPSKRKRINKSRIHRLFSESD